MKDETGRIPEEPTTRISRLLGAVFPRMPDFNRLLNDQCSLVVDATVVFVAFMETGDAEKGKEVRRLEHEGDKLKARNLNVLNRSFSTPYDREDIYRAITAIDEGLNYAKTTVREMEILGVGPDPYMLEMARLLHLGAGALQVGFSRLKGDPDEAERDAAAVRKTERQAEKVYRKAIAELFDPGRYLRDISTQSQSPGDEFAKLIEPMNRAECLAIARGLSFVMDALKRREVYRHLSNASDHMAHAGEILHDIAVKSA